MFLIDEVFGPLLICLLFLFGGLIGYLLSVSGSVILALKSFCSRPDVHRILDGCPFCGGILRKNI